MHLKAHFLEIGHITFWLPTIKLDNQNYDHKMAKWKPKFNKTLQKTNKGYTEEEELLSRINGTDVCFKLAFVASLRICLASADIHPCVPLIDLTTIQLLKEWIILSSGISYQRKLLPQRQRSASAYKFQFSPGMSHQIAPYLLLFYTPILMVVLWLTLAWVSPAST